MAALSKCVSSAGPTVLGVALLAGSPLMAAPPTAAPGSGLAHLGAKAPVMSCADLAKADLSGVVDKPIHITSAAEVADGKPAPYCRVLGYVEPAVKFEVRLPLNGWTQRYLQTGCGGLCGRLSIHTGNDMGCAPSQNGELAIASTDMGHSSDDKAWGADEQKRVDFAHRGVHVTALAAKALIEKYYGQKPRYSYFAGCSDGGREALMEAQRYPQDFNGITAGAAAMNFVTQNTFYHGWQARTNVDANGKVVLGPEKMPVLHKAALESCDATDGLKDGLIADPRACAFDPAVVQCKPGQDPASCLSPEQVDVARQIYRGAHDAGGRQLTISGPQVGSELGWPGVQVPRAAGGQDIGSRNFATEALCGVVQANPIPPSCSVNDLGFDAQAFEKLKAMHAVYDATDPDLGKFDGAGGKLILWHGWADQHISPLNSIAYYRAMRDVMGEERVKTFARLYLFPGGSHCRGGEGPFNVDLLSAIMSWVETGKAPHELIAYHTAGGEPRPGGEGGPRDEGRPTLARAPGLLPPTQGEVDRSRPVFPYPLVARYTGKGSSDDAANFVEAMPGQPLPEKFEWYGTSFFTPGYEKW
jgi:hypothetical protein